MVTFSWKSLMLKWNTFFYCGMMPVFEEYFVVFLRQLGLTPTQIGLTWGFGIPALSMAPFGYLADRFRARKLVLVTCSCLLIFLSLAPILALVTKQSNCGVEPTNYSSPNMTEELNISARSSRNDSRFQNLLNNSNLSAASKQNTDDVNDKVASESRLSLPLLLFVIILKMLFDVFRTPAWLMNNIAILTYNKKEKANFGSYYSWGQIAGGIFLFAVGMIASRTEITICGKIEHGYFVAFPVVSIMITLSLIAVPWMNYEYLERRVINWVEVKGVLFDTHYIVVLFIAFYNGWCLSFQLNWEYWYIDHLSGGPTVLALNGIIRQTLVALGLLLSVKVINKMGDLPTMAVALLMYVISRLVLSFIHNPWLVLVADIFHSLAFALSYSSSTIHFSKAGTKASSAVILAIAEVCWVLGRGVGSTCTGWLFMAFDPRTTLLSYAIFTAVVFVLFVGFIFSSKNLDDYEKVASDESDVSDDDEKY